MTDIAEKLELRRIYCSGDKEWPGYKVPDSPNASIPLLISEIFRLIPYIGADYVHFHPKNMPDVKIERVEIIGIVTDKTEMTKYTSYIVDDSTGAIPVLCGRNSVSKDQLSECRKSKNDEMPVESNGRAPNAPYSYERHIQNLWYRARDEEPLYDEIVLYDYVHVIGFCAMDFRYQKDVGKLTREDIELGRLFFFGLHSRRINEADHNAMTKALITQLAWERYLEPDT